MGQTGVSFFEFHGGGSYRRRRLIARLMASIAFGAVTIGTTVVQAQQNVSYSIPASSLDTALTRFGATSGIQVLYSAALTEGLRSQGASGNLSPQAAITQLLSGTGLAYRFTGPNAVTISRSSGGPDAASGEANTLRPIVIKSANPNSTIDLPEAYAGGQVATGGQLGLLGNRDVMDTPFSQTSYTSKLIQDQQARTVQDVLNNDPSVVASNSNGTPHDYQVIRGFGGYGTDGTRTLNGVPGMAPLFFPSTDYIERVEILKGPSALLNGMGLSSAAVSGAVGGSVNLVTKQATSEPVTQLTTRYESNSQIGTHLDVGRRFGAGDELGIRFNGSIDGGHAPIDFQHSNLGTAAINLDYAGESVRLSADFAHQYQKLESNSPYLYARNIADSLTTFPRAPGSTVSLLPPGSEQTTKSTMGMIRGEIDLLDNVTAYAAIGKQRADYDLKGFEYAWLLDGDGQYGIAPGIQHYTRDILTMQGGVRATLDTGPVNHALSLNLSRSDLTYKTAEAEGDFYTIGSMYDPVFPSIIFPADPGDPKKAYDVEVSSIGVADALSILDDRIQFLAGVRYQEVGIDNFSTTTGLKTSSYDANAWTPSFGLVVKPWENVSLYANYIEDLRPGATVSTAYANAGEVFSPYVSKQYEAGVKVDLGQVMTTLALFQIAMPNSIAIDDPLGGLPTLSQDGEQRNRGIELNVYGELTSDIRLMGGLTLIDPRLTKTDGGILDGKRNDTTPKVRAVIGGEWDTPFVEGLTLTSRLTHTGDVLVAAGADVTIPSWTTLDLGGRYTFRSPLNEKPVTVRFNVDNVFDKDYWAGAYAAGLVHRGAPRTFRLSTEFKF
ncbi:TonB-dependent receptor [Neorhizobium sp. NCHU2750]|uniref:TonB-dependent receptor n=1 Tax=Neorhizobium sp. NCHU2750 TaxID=1825976 RepID=UPI000E750BF8|nr:iron complex outermembrane recepter protein [Neorhizobium sp. NCHU2750]